MFRQKDSLFVGAKREKPDLSSKKNTKNDVLEEKKRNDFGKELKTAVSSSLSHRAKSPASAHLSLDSASRTFSPSDTSTSGDAPPPFS